MWPGRTAAPWRDAPPHAGLQRSVTVLGCLLVIAGGSFAAFSRVEPAGARGSGITIERGSSSTDRARRVQAWQGDHHTISALKARPDAARQLTQDGTGSQEGAGPQQGVFSRRRRRRHRPRHGVDDEPPEGGAAAQPQGDASAAAAAGAQPAQGAGAAAAHVRDCASLTLELVQQCAVNNTVMITVNDFNTMPYFFHHWMGNVEAAGITYWLAGVTDTASERMLEALGVHRCFRLHGTEDRHEAPQEYQWASATWAAATWRKVVAVERIVHMGFNVFNTDLDVIWLKDPMPFLGRYPMVDFFVSLDVVGSVNARGDTGLESGMNEERFQNTGIYFVRANPGGMAIMKAWVARSGQGSDQDGFNNMIKEDVRINGPRRLAGTDERVALVLNHSVALAQLPAARFLNSHTYGISRLDDAQGVEPFEIHLVWGHGGRDSKLYNIRDLGFSFDQPEYFDLPGVMSFDFQRLPEPPDFNGWTRPGIGQSHTHEEMIMEHLMQIDHQLQQLWHAFGIALALNRTLVMPRLHCFCTRNWFMLEHCRLPGDSATVLPFPCLLDQVFKPEELMGPGAVVNGVRLNLREAGFLNHTEMQAAVQRRAVVTAGSPQVCGAAAGDGLRTPRRRAASADDSGRGGSWWGAPWKALTPLGGGALRWLHMGEGVPGGGGGGGDWWQHLQQRPQSNQQPQEQRGRADEPHRRALQGDADWWQQLQQRPQAHLQRQEGPQHQQQRQVQQASQPCVEERRNGDELELTVPQHATGEQLQQLLGSYRHVRLLHFRDVTNTFSGFSDPSVQRQFSELMGRVTNNWCCRSPSEKAAGANLTDGHTHRLRPWGSSRDKLCITAVGDQSFSEYC